MSLILPIVVVPAFIGYILLFPLSLLINLENRAALRYKTVRWPLLKKVTYREKGSPKIKILGRVTQYAKDSRIRSIKKRDRRNREFTLRIRRSLVD